jgi:hypothetical protein
MKVEFITTLDDYLAVSETVRGHWPTMAAVGACTAYAGLLVVALTWAYLAWTVTPLWYAGVGLVTLFCARTYWTTFRGTPARLRATWEADPYRGFSQAIELRDDAIVHEGARGFTEYPWAALRRAHSVAGCVVLEFHGTGVVIIPAAAFASERERAAFCDVARSRSEA